MKAFEIREVKSVAGNPLWEVYRTSDGQTITEPFLTEDECRAWLLENESFILLA